MAKKVPLLLSDVDDDGGCKIGNVAPFSSESSDLTIYIFFKKSRSNVEYEVEGTYLLISHQSSRKAIPFEMELT